MFLSSRMLGKNRNVAATSKTFSIIVDWPRKLEASDQSLKLVHHPDYLDRKQINPTYGRPLTLLKCADNTIDTTALYYFNLPLYHNILAFKLAGGHTESSQFTVGC